MDSSEESFLFEDATLKAGEEEYDFGTESGDEMVLGQDAVDAIIPDGVDLPFARAEELQPSEVVARIEEHSLQFIGLLCQSEELYKLSLTSRRTNNAFFYENCIHLGHYREHKTFTSHPRSYYQVWSVLEFIHNLLQNNKKATQREVYYSLVHLFKDQICLNNTVQDVVALLNCPRRCLGLTASDRGTLVGCIQLQEAGQWIDCAQVGVSGKLISGDVKSVTAIRSDARYIIVVEKDSLFQRLSEDKVYKTIPCVLVTARGYPDLATRVLLKRLQDELHLPILGVFDWNVGGLGVMLTYKYGSVAMGLEAYNYTVDIKWLGLCWDDIQTLGLPPQAYQPLTARDRRKIDNMLESECVKANPAYVRELKAMKESCNKMEVQALHHFGSSFVSEFVVRKILQHKYT